MSSTPNIEKIDNVLEIGHSADDFEESFKKAAEYLIQLLQVNGGTVSTVKFREELKALKMPNLEGVMIRLKSQAHQSDLSETLWRHEGRRFYSPEAFEKGSYKLSVVQWPSLLEPNQFSKHEFMEYYKKHFQDALLLKNDSFGDVL